MASSRDYSLSRPVSGSFSRTSSSHRPHSNSVSLSAANTQHRVHRRKSVNASASAANQAAIAALRENGESIPLPSSSHRKSIGKKSSESHSMTSKPSMHNYFESGRGSVDQNMIDDNSMDEDDDKNFTKNRNRRASEGSHLIKASSKKGELRCESCGKGYKHSSCLTKHMWEHDPAWAVTSKLLISKHQQVQLLEAASVLCNMNAENAIAMSDSDPSQIDPSESSSNSPMYSGSSEMQDDVGSVETTPPPMGDALYQLPDSKRYSTSSTGFSRSYRSAVSSSFADSVVSPGLPPHRFSGADLRPTTSGTDDGSLAAAAAGLSFSGTPKSRPTLADDIPPVPPLPQQYQSYNSKSSNSTMTTVNNPFVFSPPALTQQLSDERNYKDDMEDSNLRRHNDLQEEGMFRMD